MRATLSMIVLVAALAGCGKEAPAPPAPDSPPRPPAVAHVDVYPFGVEKEAVFKAALAFAEGRTKVPFVAAPPVSVVWKKIQEGGKANSTALVRLMVSQAKKAKPGDLLVAAIGVCDRDIGHEGGGATCFASSKEDHAGVLSWYLLSNEALGLPSDDAKLGERAGKQLVILAARLLGLGKCAVRTCVLADPGDLPGLDAMSGDLCPACRKAWDAAVAR